MLSARFIDFKLDLLQRNHSYSLGSITHNGQKKVIRKVRTSVRASAASLALEVRGNRHEMEDQPSRNNCFPRSWEVEKTGR